MAGKLKILIATLGVALASTGVACANGDGGDGSDGGDSGMSRWTGDSYAYFRGEQSSAEKMRLTIKLERQASRKPLRGDFYTSPSELATAPSGTWGVGRAFRDDTA